MELLKHVKKMDPTIEVLVMTAFATIDTAIEALKIGARDYIRNPLILKMWLRRFVKRFLF